MTISTELVCLIAGPVIAILVSLFKKWPVVARYPKVVAMVFSVLTTIISGLTIAQLNWVEIATCVLVPFSAAIATYEVAKSSTEAK